MKKRRIVLASVLKPIDDTRMFEKLGKSLAQVPDYEITILGYPSKITPVDARINFYPHAPFNRLSLKRLLTPLHILKKSFEVKPELLIVNTHELLIVAVLSRILFGTKIVYDVQENYWRNIIWTTTYPPLIRQLLASWVRGEERLLTGYFHLVILAEKCFKDEMKFMTSNAVVLENKSSLPLNFYRHNPSGKIRLLFSGTIDESTGVMEAIKLASNLHQVNNAIELCIIGYCARPSTLTKIRQLIQATPFITLIGGDRPVPHSDIISEIGRSDFGIICYPSSPHTQNKIPTKLYEYLSAQLPILIQENPTWTALCSRYQSAISVSFGTDLDASMLLHKMKATRFYPIVPKDVYWAEEEPRLIEGIKSILA